MKPIGKIILILIMGSILVTFQPGNMENDNYQKRRQTMVESQIKVRGIRCEKVLGAMNKVPRHLFVPVENITRAYDDYPLPIGYEQTISQPYIVAYMTEILNLKPTFKVLEIGAGSGYQAAILAEICQNVYSVELVNELALRAKKLLDSLGYENILTKQGDGYLGWPEYSPFDAIIVTCAPSRIPQALQEQLAEGGTMIIPTGEPDEQKLVLLQKIKGKIQKQSVLSVRFVPMINKLGVVY